MRGDHLVDRVVCAVDGSAESTEATRQAALLAGDRGRLVLVRVVNPGAAAPAGVAVTGTPAELMREAAAALEQARADIALLRPAEAVVLEGLPIPTLRGYVEDEDATMLALGMHGHSRLAGIASGSVATAMLHEARCSVLVARATDSGPFPRAITVGFDGSPPARAALAVAQELAGRLACELTALAADGVDRARVRDALAESPSVRLTETEGDPVEALLSSSSPGTLVVLGSRGLHGLAALGSVAERVAHEASGSILVVR